MAIDTRLKYNDGRTENWNDKEPKQVGVSRFVIRSFQVKTETNIDIRYDLGIMVDDGQGGEMFSVTAYRQLLIQKGTQDWTDFWLPGGLGTLLRNRVLAAGRLKGCLPAANDSEDET